MYNSISVDLRRRRIHWIQWNDRGGSQPFISFFSTVASFQVNSLNDYMFPFHFVRIIESLARRVPSLPFPFRKTGWKQRRAIRWAHDWPRLTRLCNWNWMDFPIQLNIDWVNRGKCRTSLNRSVVPIVILMEQQHGQTNRCAPNKSSIMKLRNYDFIALLLSNELWNRMAARDVDTKNTRTHTESNGLHSTKAIAELNRLIWLSVASEIIKPKRERKQCGMMPSSTRSKIYVFSINHCVLNVTWKLNYKNQQQRKQLMPSDCVYLFAVSLQIQTVWLMIDFRLLQWKIP